MKLNDIFFLTAAQISSNKNTQSHILRSTKDLKAVPEAALPILCSEQLTEAKLYYNN